jgi:uncharacterized protein (TIGR03067 family)
MKKILGVALACAALASGDPRDYDDRVTVADLQGTWRVYSGEDDGQPLAQIQLQNVQLIFKLGNAAALIEMGHTQSMTYRIDSTRHPAHLDLTMDDGGPGKGVTIPMIYSLEGGTLKIALFMGNTGQRPAQFKTGPGSKMRILVFKSEGR